MPVRHQSDILQSFADALPFAVYVLASDRTVMVWNQAAERITGYLAQTMVGREFDGDLLIAGKPGKLNDGDSLYVRHAEGHRIPVRACSVILRGTDGTPATAMLFQDRSAGNDSLCWITTETARLDPEVGIPSQSASAEQLRAYLACHGARVGVYMVSVKGLQEYAKRCGSEMVHVTLRAVAQTIARMLTLPHYFGCWSRRRFLVLIPDCSQEIFEEVSRKLESVGSACTILWWGDRVVPHVDLVGTLATASETSEVFARLEMDPACESAAGEDRCL